MTTITNAENLRHNENTFSLAEKQIMAFTSSANLVRRVRNVSPNFEQIE